jgi:hypothetical protein
MVSATHEIDAQEVSIEDGGGQADAPALDRSAGVRAHHVGPPLEFER